MRLEVSLGILSDILPRVDHSVYELNGAYRKVVMVPGTNPDPLRDYLLEIAAPDVIEAFKAQSADLKKTMGRISELFGEGSNAVKTLGILSNQLDEFIDDPTRITSNLNVFKTNISALSSWLMEAKSQPLQLDSFCLHAPGKPAPPADIGFFEKILYEISAFAYTFAADYDSTSINRDALTVWINSGQTQLSIIKQLTESGFSQKHGIDVDIKLVTTSVLMATISGKSPDITIGLPAEEIMDFAYRGAVADLAAYPDFKEVSSRFRDSALVPLKYGGHVYGLPMAQSFLMLYYRGDILKDLGLGVPQTWDQVFSVMGALKKKNLEFGVPTSLQSFISILYQNGGRLYNEAETATELNTLSAARSFDSWSKIFTHYKSPLSYNSQNRFRTGEMPLLIDDISLYTTIEILAPELRGSWGMTRIPGTARENGAVDHSVSSTISTVSILKNARQDECWEFLKWWTGADIQEKYAKRVELSLGQSARIFTANKDAFQRLPWSGATLKEINGQIEHLIGVPSVPGSYFTSRHITNALNKVLYSGEIPGETIKSFAKTIDGEIAFKREELNLTR